MKFRVTGSVSKKRQNQRCLLFMLRFKRKRVEAYLVRVFQDFQEHFLYTQLIGTPSAITTVAVSPRTRTIVTRFMTIFVL